MRKIVCGRLIKFCKSKAPPANDAPYAPPSIISQPKRAHAFLRGEKCEAGNLTVEQLSLTLRASGKHGPPSLERWVEGRALFSTFSSSLLTNTASPRDASGRRQRARENPGPGLSLKSCLSLENNLRRTTLRKFCETDFAECSLPVINTPRFL